MSRAVQLFVVPDDPRGPPPGSKSPGEARLFSRMCDVRAREAVQAQRLAEERARQAVRAAEHRRDVRIAWMRVGLVLVWVTALAGAVVLAHFS